VNADVVVDGDGDGDLNAAAREILICDAFHDAGNVHVEVEATPRTRQRRRLEREQRDPI
jgi:hypothetical protein